ncbi:hypothetical protein C2S51_020560 [Perilla frutescens var. frutescens]|nr:hypothetical protein C2S51_020560 [Perilla frutescens var. frutescens]
MDDFIDLHEQKKLEAAMPWVGLYIAAASAVCTLAMAADAVNGFRRKKLWFPCTYFSLNPTSLTLLGVAMKLTTDLTTVMKNIRIAKFTTLIFMSTTMGNFMSSLGSMNDKHILANVVALAILVFTVIADVVIKFIELHLVTFYIAPMILMVLSLATSVSLGITVPATKRRLEASYEEKHKIALREEVSLQRKEALGVDDKRRYMMKYWVMAATSNPQFVMARSVVCTTSALMCLIALITLPIAYLLVWQKHEGPSVYRSSVEWILYTQTTGVAVGTIAPVLRWFVVVSFKCSMTNTNRLREEFKIESYWIQTLVEMRETFSDLQIGQGKFRKCLHTAKWFSITFCIGLQILIVLLSKIFVFLSALLMGPFFLCFTHINKYHSSYQSDKELNLNRYVLLLEGEAELPRTVLKNICNEADNTIQIGKAMQPRCLVKLVRKFSNFKVVEQFDSNQIPSLHSQEPPNCWTLPVVTLTSIAVAVPNIAEKERENLLSSVSQGLSLAKLVEKTLIKDDRRENIREAADVCWVGVVLYMKWLDIDLRKTSNSKKMLQKLEKKAERDVMEYLNKEGRNTVMEDPLNWPAKVVAANSMYRISRTVLLSIDEENEKTNEQLFEQLCVMIADILAACFTNLPNVITTMCHSNNAVEKREESVGKAFLVLGKTEKIVEVLQQQEWPSLDHDRAADIEEWRAFFRGNENVVGTLASISTDEEHLAVQVDI